MKRRTSGLVRASIGTAFSLLLMGCVTTAGGITRSVDFQLSNEYGDRTIVSFNVDRTGVIRLEATFSATSQDVALILNGPGKTGYYQRADGRSHLIVIQEVTPAILSLGTTWKATVTNFDVNGTAKGVLRINYPGAGETEGEISGAESRLGEELLVNGDFAQKQSAWHLGTMNGAQATFDVVGGTATIAIKTPGKTSGDIQFGQSKPGISVQDGKRYRLTFESKASIASQVPFTISENGNDVNGDGFRWSPMATGSFKPSKTLKSYQFDLTVKGDNPHAALVFYLGNKISGDLSLSNLSLKEIVQ